MMITTQDHLMAQRFYDHQQDSKKGKQVYLNTLAVSAVSRYLHYFGIETDLDNSASWDVISQHLLDTGTLHVSQIGDVECRPVLVTENSFRVPVEVSSDRLGYVAVQLDNQLETAVLLGFVKTAEGEEITLEQLQPIETLLEAIEPKSDFIAHLSQWLQDTVEAGWYTLEEILQSPEPTFRFRGTASSPVKTIASDLAKIIASDSDDTIIKCRTLVLEPSNEVGGLALAVGVRPYNQKELDIWVRVFPVGEQLYLPASLELKLMDEEGKSVMQAPSRETETMGVKFRGTMGDRFSIQISSLNTIHTEYFAI